MSALFLRHLLLHAVVFGAGLGMMQLLSRRRLPLGAAAPFAWGVGIVFLFLAGGTAVRFGMGPGRWHGVVLGLMAVMGVAGWARRFRLPVPGDLSLAAASWRWYDWALLALILSKLGLVAFVNLVHPVVDSDATGLFRQVGLAKFLAAGIPLESTEAMRPGVPSFIEPSVMTAWFALFLDRWRDGLATFPWVIFYGLWGGMAGAVCARVSGRATYGLALSFLLFSIPLGAMQAVRPGYDDLLAAFFFTGALSLLLLAFHDRSSWRLWMGLFAVFCLGLARTKAEGGMWLAWLLLVAGSYGLRAGWGVAWGRIAAVQGGVLALLYGVYWVTADWILANVEMHWHFALLFQRVFELKPVVMFLDFMFSWGTFGIFWWVICALAVGLAASRRLAADDRMGALYAGALVLGLFYFSCFTGNAEHTMAGTNVGRFFFQISGVALLLFTGFVRTLDLEAS